MLSHIFATLVLAVVCQAQVPHLGPCPKIQVKENLNVSMYLGEWYEIQKFFFLIEGSQKCIRANYSVKEDGHLKVFNRGINTDGSEATATGDAYPPDSNVPAKLAVSFNNSPRVPYWVVDTDYETYSLVWSCEDFLGLGQADFAWILSRTNTLDRSTINMLTQKLQGYSVDVSSFKATIQDQKTCNY